MTDEQTPTIEQKENIKLKHKVGKEMKQKKDYIISHTATRHQESYVIRFDNKEFFVAVKDCRKHHKDYDEITEFEIVQMVHLYDGQKISEIMLEILKDTKTSNLSLEKNKK